MNRQVKPYQVVSALVENPGAVVTREELHRQLWSEDTFVDFERGLNTAVNRLRIALGDNAETPRYVETLARVGYRFVAPVARHSSPVPLAAKPEVKSKLQLRVGAAATAAVLAALCTLGGYSLRRTPNQVHSRQITFQRGQVGTARFSSGDGILYSASWENGPRRLYLTNTVSPESRSLGFEGMSLMSISSVGELALIKPAGTGNIRGQQLFRAPLNGGAPVLVEDNLMGADWSPDGKVLAVLRAVGGANQLEAPAGRILYRTAGWIGDVRWEPDGERIAFIEHPIRHDDSGEVKLLDHGQIRELTPV